MVCFFFLTIHSSFCTPSFIRSLFCYFFFLIFLHFVVIYFWVLTKQKNKKEKIKIYIYKNIWKKFKKIIGARKRCWNDEKRTKLVEEVKKYKRLKFDIIFLTGESPVDKKNSIWEKKIQNQMFMDSIKFYLRFTWIYGGFDCKNIDLLSQFRFYWKKLKFWGPIIILKSWFGQIRGLIA